MANEQNLVSIGDQTTEKQREITRKGGIASGKARREKRDRHQRIIDLFETALENPKLKDYLEKAGINPEHKDFEAAADARVMAELLKRGDYKAWQALKEEAYGKLDSKTSVEVTGEVSGINITVKKYDGSDK